MDRQNQGGSGFSGFSSDFPATSGQPARTCSWPWGAFTHGPTEDLDLVLRLRRLTRVRLLMPPVSSSGRRWLKHGNLRTSDYHWAFLIRHLAERVLTRRWAPMGELFSG